MFAQKLNTLKPSFDFQLFYAAFCQRNLGVVGSSILISINHIQINIFLFQSFFQVFPSENIVLKYIEVLTHYFYMANLITLSTTFYFILRIIVWFVNISYLLLYLIMRLLLAKKVKIKGLEQIFTLFNTYYTMFLLLPSMEIIFKEIVCDQQILTPLNQECLQGVHIAVFILSLISLLAGLFMGFLTIFFSQNGIYDKKNYLSGENRGYEGMIALVKVLLGITVTIQNDSYAFLKIYYMVNFGCSLVVLAYFIVFFPYNKIFIEAFSLFWLAIYLVQSASMVVSVFTLETDIIASLPFLGFIIVTVVGTNYMYKKCKTWLIFKQKVSSTNELRRKVQNILQLKQSGYFSNQELYFRGLVSTHLKTCKDFSCFCKKKELFDPKKNKNLELEKWPVNKSMTLKYYVRYLFEHQIQKNHMDPDLLVAYAQFLFEKFRNTHLALSQIIKVTNSKIFLYPHQRHKIFKLRYRIFEYLTSRNQEALDISLGIENVIFVEEQFNGVLEQMNKIIHTSITFWTYLSNKEVDLDKIHSNAESLCNSVETANMLWIPLKPYLYKHKKLMYYYNWFLKDFLNKKIILSEEDVDNLFDDERCSIHSADFLSVLKNENIIFYDDTPVVHMSGNYTEMGKILKVNKATVTTFGYEKSELEKSDVSLLMPRIIASRHTYYLESYAKTGKSEVLYNQKKTFARHKEGYIFPLWILVKQLNNIQGLIQYVGLLRPLSESKDGNSFYILFDEFGEVSGLCKNAIKYFSGVDSRLNKRKFNIILLAPKMIKYLFFRQFIKDEKDKEKGLDNPDTERRGLLSETSNVSPSSQRIQDTPKASRTGRYHFGRSSSFMGAAANRLYELEDFLDLDIVHELGNTQFDIRDEDIQLHSATDEKQVEFTLRLPKKFRLWLKEFDELKTRQRNLSPNHAMDGKPVMQMGSIDSTKSSGERGANPPPDMNRNLDHFSASKQTLDSYLTALKVVAQKIAKSSTASVYRVKGVIGTDFYGPDRDKIKYLKITEILKVESKRPTFGSVATPEKNKEVGSGGSMTDIAKRETFDRHGQRDTSIKPIKMSLFSSFRGANGMIAKKGDISEIGSFTSENDIGLIEKEENNQGTPPNNVKLKKREVDPDSEGEKSSNHSKEEADDGDNDDNASKASGSESIRQAVVNELKNNLISQFQNIYYKEENMLINKNFKGLNKLRWCTYVLFLAVIPLNICFFLLNTNPAFDDLDNTMANIYTNERIRKDFLRAMDGVVTLLMDNQNQFANVTIVDQSKIKTLVDEKLTTLRNAYTDILTVNPEDDWTEVLYKYIPLVQQAKSLKYYDNFDFGRESMSLENTYWKITNVLAEISLYNKSQYFDSDGQLNFYRVNTIDLFNGIFYQTSLTIFDSITETFDDTRTYSIWCLIIEAGVLLVSLAIILYLITVVTRSLKEILKTFTVIDNQTIKDTENYYQRLSNFFSLAYSQYVNNNVQKVQLKTASSGLAGKQITMTSKYEKKFKKVTEDNFMRQYTKKILVYYILAIVISVGLLAIFVWQVSDTIKYINSVLSDAKQIVQINTVYLTSLIGLKTLFFNNTQYETEVKPYLNATLDSLVTTLDKSNIKADSVFSNFTREIYGGKVCEIFKPNMTYEDFEDCRALSLGKLSSGLVTFHNYYRDIVVDVLEQNDGKRFGEVDIDNIYEFGQLVKIIDQTILERCIEVWMNDLGKYMDSKQKVLLILIIGLNLLNAIFFYWAQWKVLMGLHGKFMFYRKVYNRYMLADALFKEKRIKARLLKFELLSK